MRGQSGRSALAVVAVVVLVAVALRSAAADAWLWWSTAVVTTAAVTPLFSAVVHLWSSTRSRSRPPRSRVTTREGWQTRAVRADAPLGRELRAHGIAADGVHSGTPLTLAWSVTHVELWRHDGEVMLSYPWREVRGLRRAYAVVGWGRRPAVVLIVPGLGWLLVAPTHNPTGGVLPATYEDVGALVVELLEVWEAAQPPKPPPPVARPKRVPVSSDEAVRWIDVELSTALLLRTRRQRHELVLASDERAAPVTEHWSAAEVAGEVRRIFYEIDRVPQEPRSTVVEESMRIWRYLRENRPELASRAVSDVLDDYCFDNR